MRHAALALALACSGCAGAGLDYDAAVKTAGDVYEFNQRQCLNWHDTAEKKRECVDEVRKAWGPLLRLLLLPYGDQGDDSVD